MNGIFALLLLIGASVSLAVPTRVAIKFESSSGKIIGGEDALRGEFPWQVSLQVILGSGESRHNCGGSILNATHIITAGHCLDGQIASRLIVIAGAHNITDTAETSQQRIPVRSYRIHEAYDGTFILNDIGLIELESAIQLNDFAAPITTCQVEPAAQELVINTGWGNAHPEGGTPAINPDILQKVNLTAISRDTCRIYYPFNIQEHMVCADKDILGGACNGDSGGPLIYKPTGSEEYCLTGIVSFGMLICGDAPSVYTSAVFFSEWLGVGA